MLAKHVLKVTQPTLTERLAVFFFMLLCVAHDTEQTYQTLRITSALLEGKKQIQCHYLLFKKSALTLIFKQYHSLPDPASHPLLPLPHNHFFVIS